MGLVKTRRLAAMHKQERAKAGMKPRPKADWFGRPKKGKSQGWTAKGA